MIRSTILNAILGALAYSIRGVDVSGDDLRAAFGRAVDQRLIDPPWDVGQTMALFGCSSRTAAVLTQGARDFYTRERDRLILEMAEAGATLALIAETVGLSDSGVRKVLLRAHFQHPAQSVDDDVPERSDELDGDQDEVPDPEEEGRAQARAAAAWAERLRQLRDDAAQQLRPDALSGWLRVRLI